jgi:hypothetical protein
VARKFLLVKGRSGLGNRLEVLMGGLVYARLANREVIVDWRDREYSSDRSNVFPRLFHSSSITPVNDIAALGESVYPPDWRGHLNEPVARMAHLRHYDSDAIRDNLSIDLRTLDYDEQVVVLTGFADRIDLMKEYHCGLSPELDRHSREEIIAAMLKTEILPSPEVRGRVDRFKQSHFAGPVVGVHARYSDYRVKLLSLLHQLNALLRRHAGLQVFLATDNVAVLELFQRHYPVISTPHWYDQTGVALHKSKLNRNRPEGALEAATDMYLLAECDYLVIDSSSSFAYLASLMFEAGPDRIRDVSSGQKRYPFLTLEANRRLRVAITNLLQRTQALSWGLRAFGKVVSVRML